MSLPSCSANPPVSRAIRLRRLNDGQGHSSTWTYAYSGTTGSSTTTVTDPAGNDTVHVFTALDGHCVLYETQTRYYQGSSTTGTLLKQTDTLYTFSLLNDDSGANSSVYGNIVADSVKTTPSRVLGGSVY